MKNFTMVLMSRDRKVLRNKWHRPLALAVMVAIWSENERLESILMPRSGENGGVGKMWLDM